MPFVHCESEPVEREFTYQSHLKTCRIKGFYMRATSAPLFRVPFRHPGRPCSAERTQLSHRWTPKPHLLRSTRRGIEPRASRCHSLFTFLAPMLHAMAVLGAWQTHVNSLKRLSDGEVRPNDVVREVSRLGSPNKRRPAVDAGAGCAAMLFAGRHERLHTPLGQERGRGEFCLVRIFSLF